MGKTNLLTPGQQLAPEPLRVAARFPVIGLGASAGGFQALKEFFTNMPAESGMAFVVIMHLSPRHESHVAALLQTTTGMTVTQVTETVRVQPNHVYVIPPTNNLEMADGHITLTEPEPLVRGQQVAIDLFFRTLAETHQQQAVGIVLSGMGSDGTIGLRRIKEHNGLAFAQDPQESEQDSMPRHAIKTGLVDFVLPVAEMPAKLIQLWHNASRIKLPPETAPSPTISQEDADELALRDTFLLLRSHTGHDFTHYKRTTVLRRIERRLQVNQLPDITAYRDFMREHAAEAQALLKDLLISVTNFFRDHLAFVEFERAIVPLLFHEKTADDDVRVWVAGCATGEEAYSVAILLLEYAERLSSPPSIQIFASDIDEAAILTARAGSYTENIEADVSPERLHRFFTKQSGGYRIKKEVRERVLFAAHNLIKDPPFSRLDAVTCRNLLIYLNRDAQARVFELFQFVLRPNGFLLLGNSESVDGVPSLFKTVDQNHRIYRAESVGGIGLRVPSAPLAMPSPRTFDSSRQGPGDLPRTSGELHQKLWVQYAPPSVIINAAYDIVHMSDSAGRFMQFKGGEPSRNLLKVVYPELRVELRAALFQAAKTSEPVETQRVRIKRGVRSFYVNMIARPAGDDAATDDYFLVLFDDVEDTAEADSSAPKATENEPVMRLLEEELQSSKEQLQATIEQYETQAEELKASNEELLATNEELRSATEELETSKEEMQSVNEEVSTINNELKNRLDDLTIANSDLQNLISSTDLATIFLDRNLNVKFFTPRAQDLFNLIPADVGRPLSDITHSLNYADMLPDVAQVLSDPRKVERAITSRDDRSYLAQVMPYRTAAVGIEGVILTFTDFTARKLAEESMREATERLGLLVESAKDHAIYTMNADGRINYWNSGAQALFGYTENEIIGQSTALLFTFEDRERKELEREMREASERGSVNDERWYVRKDGTRFYASGFLFLLRDERVKAGTRHGFAMIARDLTERKTAADASIRFQARLLDAVEQSVIATSLNGTVIYWNRFAQQLYGWTAEEAIGRHIMELTTPDSMVEQGREILSHLRRGESWNGEFTVQRRDGTRFPAQIINSPINDKEGTLIGIVGVSVDITERKAGEQSLRESENKYRLLMEQASDGIHTYDIEGNILEANSRLCEMLGYTREELLKLNVKDLTPAGDLAVDPIRFDELLAGKTLLNERRLRRKDGVLFTVEISGRMIRDNVLQAIIRDISERKRQEESLLELTRQLEQQSNVFNTTLSSITDFAYIFDRDGRFLYANQPLLDLWDLKLDEAVGKNFFDLQYPNDLAVRLQEQIQQVIETGQPLRDETPYTSPTGAEGFYEYIFTPVKAADGAVEVVAGSTRDYTERKHTEILLDTQRQALEMVVSGSPLGEVLKYLAGIVEHQSGSSSIASIMLLDDQGRLHTGAAPSLPEDYIQAIEGIKADENVGTCSAAAATRKAVVTPDIANDPRWRDFKHLPLGLGLQSAWSLPIVAADNRVLGTFGTYFHEKREPTRLERETVAILAKTAALAIERNQAEEALRQAHERITNIFESITDCFYALDADFRFTYVNPQTEAYFGMRKEEMLGHRYVDVLPKVRGHEGFSKLQKAFDEQTPLQFEIISPATGKWVDLHVFPAKWGLSIYFRDVTQRKQAEAELNASEERLRTIFEASRDGILVEDNELIVFVNQSYTRLFGYESPADLIGKHISAVISAEDTQRLLEFGQSRARGKLPVSVYEFKGKRKDGTTLEVEASVSASSVGGHSYITTILRDITQRKRAEEELKKINEELEARVEKRTADLTKTNDVLQKEIGERLRIEAERTELLRRIVFTQEDERRRISREMHDQFGQQLTVLKLKLDAAKEGCGEKQELCEQIAALQALATQLDADVDHMVWEMRPTALDDLGLQAALSSYVQKWSQHLDIPVQVHASGMDGDRLNPEVETTLYRISQEALNNIAKHAQASHVAVVLERRADQVSLIVEDDGVGFDIQKVFDARARGLGLVGMRERAALVGGTIEIESEPSLGATVVARIPVPAPREIGQTDE